MMDYTDRHFRFLCRLLSHQVLLYSEMIVADAILHGNRDKLLGYDAAEHPVVLQLGGSDPAKLGEAAAIAWQWGYDEINLNCGCPSDRVQNNMIGACLMDHPHKVAEGVAAMKARVPIPITVKHRIGVDNHDTYDHMAQFVEIVAQAGCSTFIVHARKAWLQGLSPRENREIPPLRYDDVWRLKREFPHLNIEINGGIRSLEEALTFLNPGEGIGLDGVMMGRAIYDDPGMLARADELMFGDPSGPPLNCFEVVRRYIPYVEQRLHAGETLHPLTRHLHGLFRGQPGARRWRRFLSESSHVPGAGAEILERGLDLMLGLQEQARASAEVCSA